MGNSSDYPVEPVDFRRIFEAGPSVSVLLKADAPRFTVISVTDRLLSEGEYSRQVLENKGLFEIYKGEHVGYLSQCLNKAVAQKAPVHLQLNNFSLKKETDLNGPDAGLWNVTLNPILLDGEIQYITMRGENASQFENIKRLGDNLPDGAIYQIVEEPNGDLYFSYMSAGIYRLLGITVPEVIENAQNLYDLILPEDLELMKEKDQESLRTMSPFECRIRMRTRNGEIKWVECRSSPRRLEDGSIIADGILNDITERKESEEKLHRALKDAEAANMAKSDFLANMSHEIRTPMNAVVGISNLLSNSQLSQEKQKDLLVTLQNSADNLLGLINDMLDFARIEEGKVHLEEIEFNLAEIVEKSLSVIRIKAQEKGLYLRTNYDSNLPRNYIGDPLRVQQILMNLLSNAVKFTREGGVEIRISEEDNFVKLQIIDTGIGIAKDNINTIFEKFSQAESSTARMYGGSGLGLAICKALAEHMGGRITAKSTPHEGSVFTVWLNLKINKTSDILKKFEASPPLSTISHQGNILLVEDHYPNILVATTLLEELGYDFDVAKSGHEAIEKFPTRHWDVILMDLSMPGMDGFETSQHIRKLENEKNIPPTPIIAMTAHATEGIRQECLQAGMNDYISKPYSAAELMNKLSNFTSATSESLKKYN